MRARDERLWLIELISYWEGAINATRLSRLVDIGRQQATADLTRYRQQYPDNLAYSPSCKAYLAQDRFQCGFISTDVAEYLRWSAGIAHSDAVAANLDCTQLQLPPRQVSPFLMRNLVHALREQRRIEVDYVSLSNPDFDGRVIVPHTFVNTGLRWHLRAWCEKSRAYRDFVLSRFGAESALLDVSPQGTAQDDAWNTEIILIIKPDPRLSPAKQRVLERDYAMRAGELKLNSRAALAQYLLQEMHINHKVLDGTPEAQQLILANLDEVRQWLF